MIGGRLHILRHIGIRRGSVGTLAQDESGATAIEMAFLAPVFLLLLIGIVQGGLIVFTKASLHYAVQKHVRCISISDPLNCPDAETHYFAPGATPTFTETQPAGSQKCVALTGAVTYDFNIGLMRRNIPLSSTACFPDIRGAPSS